MKSLLTSCFGLGKLPIAPGTWGSVAPVVIFMVLGYFAPAANPAVMGVFVLAGTAITILFSPHVIAKTRNNDPSEIVSDEWAGQSLVLLIACFFPAPTICLTAAIAFGLFRIFDIFKPWPCKQLEHLPAGWGIAADDLAAGLWAAGVFVVANLLPPPLSDSQSGGLTVWMAIFLGALQGLTEFLPVSSSGHLVVAEHILPLPNPEGPQMLLFDLSLHIGTVLSIAIVYYRSFILLVRDLANFKRYGSTLPQIVRKSPSIRLILLAILTTVITGLIYVFFKDPLESARKPIWVALFWAITACVLMATDYVRKNSKGIRRFSPWMAIGIGVAQDVAILPGVSRSGSTISAAILLGLKRRWAIEFSFLISIPAILGGTVVKLIDDRDVLFSDQLPLMAVLCGVLAATVVGVAALKVLIRISRKRKFRYFAIYCWILAAIIVIWLV